jgi:hypothetical protein
MRKRHKGEAVSRSIMEQCARVVMCVHSRHALILGQSPQSGLSLRHQQHAQMLGECTDIAGPHVWHLGFLVFFSFRCILDVPQE